MKLRSINFARQQNYSLMLELLQQFYSKLHWAPSYMKNSAEVLLSLLTSHHACFKSKTMAVRQSILATLKMTMKDNLQETWYQVKSQMSRYCS